MRCSPFAFAAVAIAATLAACGGGDRDKQMLTVSAAASLKNAFENYADEFGEARVRYSFAGSDELAAQIRQGAKPDVFAAANTKLPEELHRAGLVDKPAVFARNRLVLAVPIGPSTVDSIADLEREGVDLVAGSPSVPVGAYTRAVLERLGATRADRILSNVRSNEPDVVGVVGKLTQRAADAGFVYITDVMGAGGELREIELPRDLRPSVEYGIALVRGTDAAEEATAFVEGLMSESGRAALRDAGFELPSS